MLNGVHNLPQPPGLLLASRVPSSKRSRCGSVPRSAMPLHAACKCPTGVLDLVRHCGCAQVEEAPVLWLSRAVFDNIRPALLNSWQTDRRLTNEPELVGALYAAIQVRSACLSRLARKPAQH